MITRQLGSFPPKKIALLFAGLAVFAAGLVFGVNFLLKKVPGGEAKPSTTLPAPDVDIRMEPERGSETPPNEPPPGEIKVIEAGTVDSRPIRYTDTGFTPKEITVKFGDPLGCIITVLNRSSKALKVGVNPHSPEGDPGVNYGELAPGQVGIYDVRYSGFDEITLHNHFDPAEEFKVIYGEGCK